MKSDVLRWQYSEIAALQPPEHMTIAEHGERFCELPKDSQTKGRWIAGLTPFVIPIFEAFRNPYIREISIIKSSQAGASVAVQVIVGYVIDQLRQPVLICLESEETANFMSDQRYQHMFDSEERYFLRKDVTTWTKSRMAFHGGGYLEFAWAGSVGKTASRSIALVVADEIDKAGYLRQTREAPSLQLLASRAKTYGNSKFIKLSTPTDETGNIATEIQRADAVFDWHVSCPYCGQFQPLNFWMNRANCWFPDGQYRSEDNSFHPLGKVVWEGGREATNRQILETARYECGSCGKYWTTEQKNAQVLKGRAVSRRESDGYERHIAFQFTDLISPFKNGRLEEIVFAWVSLFQIADKEKRDELTQDFYNSTLGEIHKRVIIQTTEKDILKARTQLSPQIVPESAIALTCGIDVQKHGFWFAVRAFAADYTSWLIHYGFLATERELENLLFETIYPQEGKTGLRIWRAGIDTGGGETGEGSEITMTDRTYLWLEKNWQGRGCIIFPTKGASHTMKGRIVELGSKIQKLSSGQALSGSMRLHWINTFDLKRRVHDRLNLAIESNEKGVVLQRSAFLHNQTDHVYVNQISAEELRNIKGVLRWVNSGRRDNHLFDCEVICHAISDIEWPGGGVHLRAHKEQVSAPPDTGRTLKSGDWFRRGRL